MRLPYQDIQFSFLIVVFVADRFRSKLRCTWTSRVWTKWFISIFCPVCTIVVFSSVEMIDNRIDFIAIDCWHFGRNFSNFIASVHPKRTVSWFLRCSNKIYEKNATQNNPHCDPVWEVKSIFRCNLLQFFFFIFINTLVLCTFVKFKSVHRKWCSVELKSMCLCTWQKCKSSRSPQMDIHFLI